MLYGDLHEPDPLPWQSLPPRGHVLICVEEVVDLGVAAALRELPARGEVDVDACLTPRGECDHLLVTLASPAARPATFAARGHCPAASSSAVVVVAAEAHYLLFLMDTRDLGSASYGAS